MAARQNAAGDLEEALAYIDPESLDYDEWFRVGAALHADGYDFEVWDRWLRDSGSPKYEGSQPLMTHWRSFHDDGGITGASVARMAMRNGWRPSGAAQPRREQAPRMRSMRLEDNVLTTVEQSSIYAPPNEELREETHEFDLKMLRKYIETLFKPGDIVAWVPNCDENEHPSSAGQWEERDKLLRNLTSDGLSALYGMYLGGKKPECGCWIRFNPTDRNGAKDSNIVDFRYALVEADSGEPEQQQATMEAMHLPIVALTFSGKKSMHAIVAVDAATRKEYDERVQLLYAECKAAGLNVDRQNKNPARLSRMPGIVRHGVLQRLMYVWSDRQKQRPTWAAWRELLAEEADTMPKTTTLADLVKRTDCNQAPELISGVLRRGHKMMLSAPSKAGKSFLLMELCASLADGPEDARWLRWGLPERGHVLYVNLELDEPDCRQRFIDIYKAMGIGTDKISDNLSVLNLRGHGAPLDQLAPFIIKRCEQLAPLLMVVLDPMYKISTGDENNASDMGKFCNALDTIASCGKSATQPWGPSVVYAHHFIKTGFMQRDAMSRASGSGVFVRDGDALITISPVERKAIRDACKQDRHGNLLEHPRRPFRVDGSLRSFPDFDPFGIWFEYPVHYEDVGGAIMNAMRGDDAEDEGGEIEQQTKKRATVDDKLLGELCEKHHEDANAIAVIAAEMGFAVGTIKNHLKHTIWLANDTGITKRPPAEQKPKPDPNTEN